MLLLVLLSSIFMLGESCEPIREPMCQTGLSYNLTIFPNLAGHLFQGGAVVALRNLKQLIDKQCSPNIREFLCRMYLPECSASGIPVMPSWEMCQEAHDGCASLMSSIGYSWSFSFNCTRFEVSTIANIKKIANDGSTFWFGSGVTSLCSGTHTTFACKINPRPGHVDSIVSRFAGNVDISNIDRPLEISYSYEKGQIKACDNEYTLPGGHFEADPLSTKVHTPWEVRNLPKVEWSHKPSQYFTFVLYDVGFGFLHSLYVNIPGINFTLADEVFKHVGPLNPTEVANPYVFLVYEQSGVVQLTDSLRKDLNTKTLSTLHNTHQFIGPKAISWVLIQEDPYSVQSLREHSILNNCPSLVSNAIHRQHRPFIPSNLKLEMSVDVTYSPASIKFTSCCKNYVYRGTSFNVNPIGNLKVKTAYVRSSVIPSVTLTKRDRYPAAINFSDELYTMIMVDPDVSVPYAGTQSYPLIHWMILNIPNGNVNDGLTVREYKGPLPSSGTHTYYFLVYHQSSVINPSVLGNYTLGTCSRCKFDINNFTKEEGLTLTGASWMRAEFDEYVRHVHIDENSKDIAAECAHKSSYPQSCSSGFVSEIIG